MDRTSSIGRRRRALLDDRARSAGAPARSGRGHPAPRRPRRADRPRRSWASPRRAVACRRPADAEDPSGVALLLDPARVHDVDPVADGGREVEVVRDEEHAHAAVARCRPRTAMISAWVVTSRAVVGSSHSSRRGGGERAGDHDPLEHAAGQFVRVLAQVVLGVGQAHRGAVRRRGRGPVLGPAVAGRSDSVRRSPMRRTGLMPARGSWKTMPALVRRRRAARRRRRPRRCRPRVPFLGHAPPGRGRAPRGR